MHSNCRPSPPVKLDGKAMFKLQQMYHESLHGRFAVAACGAFLDLVRVKGNAELVKAELAAIQTECSQGEGVRQDSAPFLSWMLFAALRIRPEDKCSISMEDPNMGSCDGDYNDGITVFDVTDPMHCAYCFVSTCGFQTAVVRVHGAPQYTPLTAEEYIRAYHPQYSRSTDSVNEGYVSSKSSELMHDIDRLKGERCIERWMLHEAWPNERYGPCVSEDGLDGEENYAAQYCSASTVPSLSELALRRIVAQAAKSGDISGLEVALSLPGVGASSTLNMLAELDHYSDEIFAVLMKGLQEDRDRDPEVLNLSPYRLSAKQVLYAATQFPSIKVLNLSGNTHVDRTIISRILPTLPSLSQLNIYNCGDIVLSDIQAIRSLCPQLEVIYHRCLMIYTFQTFDLRAPMARRDPRPLSFTFYFDQQWFVLPAQVGCTLRSYSPRQIVVSLCDFYDRLHMAQSFGLGDSNRNDNLKVIFSGLSRPYHIPFNERILGNIPQNMGLETEGWLYALIPARTSEPNRAIDWLWGFVKYKFTDTSGTGEVKRGVRPALEDVRAMDLTAWLQSVDPIQTVEGEWIKRLEMEMETAGKIFSKETATRIIQDIPMCARS